MPPLIVKKGTVALDLVEATPIVFGGVLYRFEYLRTRCKRFNDTGDGLFQFVDVEANRRLPGFAYGFHCGCACVHDGVMHVFGTNAWAGNEIYHWTSTDLENWTAPQLIASEPDWEAYNSSCCHDGKRFILAYERKEPEEIALPFTFFFMESFDGVEWRRMDEIPPFGREKPFCGGPTLDYSKGYFYLAYLAGNYEDGFNVDIARSIDLCKWEESPCNPFFTYGEEDRKLAHDDFSPEEKETIAGAVNINASDVEYVEWQGKTFICYSWGDQRGHEFLAEAESPVPLEQFLAGWFE